MTTIDNIMELAEQYASQWENSYKWDEANTALRTAVTEAYKEAFARGMAVRPASAALAKDASLICEGTKPQTDMPFVPWAKEAELIESGTKPVVCINHDCAECKAKEDAESLLQDVSAYIGVGGFNGATPKQLSERICVEFERLNNKAQTAQPVREPLSISWPHRVEHISELGYVVWRDVFEGLMRCTLRDAVLTHKVAVFVAQDEADDYANYRNTRTATLGTDAIKPVKHGIGGDK